MKRMMCVISLLILGQGIAAASPLSQVCDKHYTVMYTETFAGASNQGEWGFDGSYDRIERSGGDPGEYFHNSHLVTFAPRPATGLGTSSEFTGNYRERGVFSVGGDFRTLSVTYTADKRPMSLVLVNHAGTPRDISDDLYVFFVGRENIPQPGDDSPSEWAHYEFPVPADSRALPFPRSEGEWQPGWGAAVGHLSTPARDPDAVWSRVIQDVDQVIFWFHDPRLYAMLQDWDVGMDNLSVATCFD